VRAWQDWLRIGILDYCLDFAELSLPNGSGPLFLRTAIAVLDLHKTGMRHKFAVDVDFNLELIAGRIEALCGIWATGKYFPPVGSCRVACVRSGR
jgi:hypothetical protein